MRQNKRVVTILLIFVIALMAITMVAGRHMQSKLNDGEAQIRTLQQAIDAETARTEEIREMQEYMQSDEYKEQIAKDRLGLIRDGEIIFKEADKE